MDKIEAILEQNIHDNAIYQQIMLKTEQFQASKDRAQDQYQDRKPIHDVNVLENLPYVKVNPVQMAKQSEPEAAYFENQQICSILGGQNLEINESRSGLASQGHYKHYTGTDYQLEERSTRNVPNTIKSDKEL